jgi:hypothetical protein
MAWGALDALGVGCGLILATAKPHIDGKLAQ